MKLVKFNENGNDIMFVCDSRNTRHGFAHDATMFINDCDYATAHCYYLNRTWESWNYQSACLSACRDALERHENVVKSYYKASNGIKRMTAKRNVELQRMIDADEEVQLYKAILYTLKNRYF